jgi:trehalose/maltose hydrolase-like predicted phosphorylase
VAVITSYTTLLSEAASWLARSDLTTSIPGFVQSFEENFLCDPENHASWMESALSVTLSNNVAALPSDYLGLRIAYFSGYQPLNRVSLEQLYKRYPRGAGTSGTAKFIARNASNFEFGPEGTSGTLLGTYYAKPTLLRSFASDAAAHFLIVNCPQMLLWGTLLAAEPFLKNDARVMIWKSALDMEVISYRKRFVEENYSGSAPFTVAV